MKIIAFLNVKGGSGKTTTTINVADCLKRMGFKVIIVDTDPQLTVSYWAEWGENPVQVSVASTIREIQSIPRQLDEYDYVLIDGAGKMDKLTAAAITVSDLVVVPIIASGFDLAATDGTLELISVQRKVSPVKTGVVVVNTSRNNKMVDGVIDGLRENDWHVFNARLGARETYKETATVGGTVFFGQNRAAKTEVQELVTEIVDFVQ